MRVFKREFLTIVVVVSVLFLDLGTASALADNAIAPTQAVELDLNAAKAALKAKEYDRAIGLISPHLDVANREAFLILAAAYTSATNHTMAEKTLNTALAKFKGDREIQTEVSRTLLALNREIEAKATLKNVIDLHPKYEPAYLLMAEIYEKKKNRYELRLLYQDLVKHVGEKASYMTKLCELATREGHYDVAFRFCERGLALNPKEPLNYINVATAYKETGQSKKADQFFKKAADSFSKSEPAQIAYASFLDENKDYVHSYPYWKRATVASKDSIRGWTGTAFAAIEVQKFAEALPAFERLCELDKNAERQLRRAASSLKTMGQNTWYEKMTELISKCDEKNLSRGFM